MRPAGIPGNVSPGLLALVSDHAPSRTILCAGAGSYEQAFVTMTQGIHVGRSAQAAEAVAASWSSIADRTGEFVPGAGSEQGAHELKKAGFVPADGEA